MLNPLLCLPITLSVKSKIFKPTCVVWPVSPAPAYIIPFFTFIISTPMALEQHLLSHLIKSTPTKRV